MSPSETLSIARFLTRKDPEANSSGSEIAQLRETIRSRLFESPLPLVFDLTGVRSLSPSFAFQAFALAFDSAAEIATARARISFINDDRELSSRVLDALNRRENLLKLTA